MRDVVHSAANHGANLASVLGKPGLLIPRDTIVVDRLPDPDPTSESLGAPAAARKPGTSPSPVPFGSAPLSRIPRPSSAFSPLLSLARTSSSVLPLSAPKLAFRSALLYSTQQGESKRTNRIGVSNASQLQDCAAHLMHPSRARDLKAGTRAIWLSVSVPRHVSLGRVRTVICWSVVLVVSLPVPGKLTTVTLVPTIFSIPPRCFGDCLRYPCGAFARPFGVVLLSAFDG